MGKLLIAIYLAGSLAVIYGAATIAESIIKGKKRFSDKIISDRLAIVMAIMLVFAPTHWTKSNFDGKILDGEYRINAAVEFPDSDDVLYLPADIYITSDVEYRDNGYYLGGVELSSSNAVLNRTIYLWTVYTRDGVAKIFSCDDEVRAEFTEEIWVDDDIYKVNIGVITPEILGISNKDIWGGISLLGKVEIGLVCFCSALGVVQYLATKRDTDGSRKSTG